jgi:hypothetical protein
LLLLSFNPARLENWEVQTAFVHVEVKAFSEGIVPGMDYVFPAHLQ